MGLTNKEERHLIQPQDEQGLDHVMGVKSLEDKVQQLASRKE